MLRDGSRAMLAGACGALLALACAMPCPAGARAVRLVSPLPASEYSVQPVCARAPAGHARCLALELEGNTPQARAHAHPLGIARLEGVNPASTATEVCQHHKVTENCYGLIPEDLRDAYALPTNTEAAPTQTIALVDAFNDPDAEADLEVFDKALSLSECTAANQCFKQVNQLGESGDLPFPHSLAELKTARKGAPSEREEAEEAGGWASEEALDVEVAHGLCQKCHILLVEASSSATADMEAAERQAVAEGATEVSNSWYTEEPEPSRDSPAFDDPGTVITAAAGDEGFLNWAAPGAGEKGLVNYPASSPHVVAVGGTRLQLSPSNTREGETVWNGKGPGAEGRGAGGSGCSERFAAPLWQQELAGWPSVGCAGKRAVADVAADADPYTGVAVYDSTPDRNGQVQQWEDFGGTSLAAPIIAATFALAGGSGGVEYPAQTLYESAAKSSGALYDVEAGSNGQCLKALGGEGLAGCSPLEEAASCAAAAICLAGAGYDGPSGLGAPNGLAAFEAQGIAPRRTQLLEITSAAPSSARAGGKTYTVEARASSGLPPSFSSATPEVCTLAGSSVSFTAVGTCTIGANQGGDSEYDAAPEVQQSFEVGIGTQTIRFTTSPPEPALIGGPEYTPSAHASSGLPVVISSATPAVCAVSGASVSFAAAGICTLAAQQAGDASYLPAPELTQSFEVRRKAQAIQFTSSPPEPAVIGGPEYTVTALASSGATVSMFHSATPSVCAVQGSSVSFIAAGTCEVLAKQPGSADYEPAPEAAQSFPVLKKEQTIEFTSSPPGSATVGGAAYAVLARSSVGLPVSVFSLTPSVCFVTVSQVSFVEAATCTLEAAQPGDADYEAAAPVLMSFAVQPPASFTAPLVSPIAPAVVPAETTTSSPQPKSSFSLLGRPSANHRTGAVTLALSVANAGTLSWRLTFHGGIVFARGARTLAAPGAVSLTLQPSRAGAKALLQARAHGSAVVLLATLEFQSSLGGAPSSQTLSLGDRLGELHPAAR